jgi:hypothetical protein
LDYLKPRCNREVGQVEPDLSLDDAVRRWQALREQGRTAGVDDLCADCPDKTAYLSERLRAVASLAAFLGLTPETIETQVETPGQGEKITLTSFSVAV